MLLEHVPNYMQPNIMYDSNGNAVMLPQPFMEITAPREIDLNRVIELSTSLLVVLYVVFLWMLYQNRLKNNVTSKVQISDSDLKSSPSKEKRVRKSGKNNIIVEENIRIQKGCRK